MIVHQIIPASGIRTIHAVVAFALFVMTILMAGCVSPGTGNHTFSFPKDRYVFLQHTTDLNSSTMSGTCIRGNPDYAYDYHYDENKRIITYYLPLSENGKINESLRLFYGHRYMEKGEVCCGNIGGLVYSTPREFRSKVTIESVRGDGTVALRYYDTLIVLKTNEHWQNISHQERKTEPIHTGVKTEGQTDEIILPGCSEDIIITDTIYNAGFYNKETLVIQKIE